MERKISLGRFGTSAERVNTAARFTSIGGVGLTASAIFSEDWFVAAGFGAGIIVSETVRRLSASRIESRGNTVSQDDR